MKNKASNENISKPCPPVKTVSHDITIADLLGKKLKRYITKLAGLEKGNLYKIVLHGVERPLFDMVLQETQWNQQKAANILGINRNTLRKKIKEYGLKNEK